MNTETANVAEIDLRDRDAVAAVLRTVPRRFVVGFAARCARRVQPELLVRLPWDEGFVLYHLADGLITIAEGYAAGMVQRVRHDDLLSKRRDLFWDKCHMTWPTTAAAYAAYAADDDDAADHAAHAAHAYAAADRGRAESFAIHDFKTVSALTRNTPDDFLDDRPVPEGFFGPLWVDGMPEEYKAALAKLNPQNPPAPEVAPDNYLADLSDEGKAALEDRKWVSRQLNLGTFDEFGGEYIAVVGKKVLGHDRSLLKLRADVTTQTGIPPNRLVTRLVHRPRRTPTPDTNS